MLSRLAFLLKQDGGSGEDSEALSAASAVPSFAAPLLQSLAWLSTEISASHVIRSTVCVLSGLPVVAERKVPPCPRAICRCMCLCLCLCLCMLRHPPSLTNPPSVSLLAGEVVHAPAQRGAVRAAGEAAERRGQVLHRRDLLLPSASRVPR